jgi:hypothetical protein
MVESCVPVFIIKIWPVIIEGFICPHYGNTAWIFCKGLDMCGYLTAHEFTQPLIQPVSNCIHPFVLIDFTRVLNPSPSLSLEH